MKRTRLIRSILGAALLLISTAIAQVPNILNYQGRIAVRGVNFDGAGQFKFALVNNGGTTTFWSNDGTSIAGSQPVAAVGLTVTKGLYSVMLGNTGVANMSSIPATVFNNADVWLRVWFNDGSNGFQLITPDQRIGSVGYAIMAGNVPDGSVTEAKIANGSVSADKLASGAAAANLNASGLAGVATGGIILAEPNNVALAAAGYTDLNLSMKVAGTPWQEGSTVAAPSARYSAATVWTGSEFVLWGGRNGSSSFLGDGARYNPSTETWQALPAAGGFQARNDHTAVWTGTDMIIWGGWANYPNFYGNGTKFTPGTNLWSAMSSTGAPAARTGHTAVWTGTQMIVWGGGFMPDVFNWINFNNGGRYDPALNTWTAVSTTNAPVARGSHVAVWTGTEMIVWGGGRADGGRYNPQTNSWRSMSTLNAPTGRLSARAFWTGSKMIVWGGEEFYQQSSPPNTGGIYDPTADTWTPINSSVIAGRLGMVAAWTGTEMIVLGGQVGAAPGFYGDGARFNPSTMTWTKMMAAGAPSARSFGSVEHIGGVWTGSRLIFFGGYTGANSPLAGTYIYNPAQDVEFTLNLYRK